MKFLKLLTLRLGFGLQVALAFPSLLHAAAAVVQSVSHVCSGSVASCSTTINGVVSGRALLVAAICGSSDTCGNKTGGWSDGTNTYGDVVGFGLVNLARALSVGSGNFTVTFTPISSNWTGLGVMEVSGLHATPDDGFESRDDPANATANTDPVTTTASGICMAAVGVNAATSITPDATWTQVFEDETFANITGSMIYKLTSAGSNEGTWTLGSAVQWSAAIECFKESAAVATAPRHRSTWR